MAESRLGWTIAGVICICLWFVVLVSMMIRKKRVMNTTFVVVSALWLVLSGVMITIGSLTDEKEDDQVEKKYI